MTLINLNLNQDGITLHTLETYELLGKTHTTWSETRGGKPTHFSFDCASFSDYSGGIVAESNFKHIEAEVLKNKYPYLIRYGHYGTKWICITIPTNKTDQIEMIDFIEDILSTSQSYSILNDDIYYALESERKENLFEELKNDFESSEIDFDPDALKQYIYEYATEQDGGQFWVDTATFLESQNGNSEN